MTRPVGLRSTLPRLAKWTNSCWKPLRPPVLTVPILKSTVFGPGTFDSTATIVRSRILICTFALFCGFDVASWCEASATMPPTHSPGGVPDGTWTVNPTCRFAPGASVTEVESSVIHDPARVGVLSVS